MRLCVCVLAYACVFEVFLYSRICVCVCVCERGNGEKIFPLVRRKFWGYDLIFVDVSELNGIVRITIGSICKRFGMCFHHSTHIVDC